MSWLFSRALVGAFSAGCSSAGAPSAPSSATPTPQAYLSPDRMTAFSRLSRSGMTFAPLTDDRGEDVLTWFLAVFPVRTSARQEKVRESMESAADCGRKWRASLARYDRATRSWRTHQFSLLGGLTAFSGTLPLWGMTVGGELYPLQTAVPRTNGTASGLWPTVTVSGNNNRKGVSQNSGDGLATAVRRRWPTATASASKGSSPAALTRKDGRSRANDRLDYAVMDSDGGPLNPTWVEWLMGWPLGWTDCAVSVTDRFRSWLQQHGGC